MALFSFSQYKPIIVMRKLLLTLMVIIVIGACSGAYAQEGGNDYRLGFGVRFSSPAPTLSNSVSVKYMMPTGNAIEGLISFGGRFGIGGLYEVHRTLNGTPGLKWFYGGGAYLGFQSSTTYLGPTGIVGLDYKFNNIPLNLSIDWKPELDILPKIDFVPDAFAITARFTLN